MVFEIEFPTTGHTLNLNNTGQLDLKFEHHWTYTQFEQYWTTQFEAYCLNCEHYFSILSGGLTIFCFIFVASSMNNIYVLMARIILVCNIFTFVCRFWDIV